MKTIQNIGLALSMFLAASCTQQNLMAPGEKDKDKSPNTSEDGDILLEDESPDDSTGATVSVSLEMNASNSNSLALLDGHDSESTDAPTETTTAESPADDADTTKKISDTISLDMARFNLWAIKVKAKKEQSDKEKDLEKIEKKEEVNEETELESGDKDDVQEGDEVADQESDKKGNSEVGAELTVPEMMDQSKKDDHIKEKFKEDREHHKEKLKAAHERDMKRDRSRRFRGPYIYDAIAGKMEGDEPKVDLNDGSYRRIEFKLKRNVSAEDTDPILGNVFVIRGTYTKSESETGVAFAIDWHSAMNFRLKGEKAFKVEAEGDTKLSIVFDMGKWFDGIDMSTAVAGEDGVIYINKKSNRSIMKQLRKNIKMNCRFGKDKNGDGKLDADETAGQGEDTPDAEGE